ncbi:MAG: hypothetical protein CMD96_06755 [Gammaproteobacteria bacterium]|nr:hypothetical protein [Gammaproteobacteria bacterium]HJP19814.1 oligosaccharide flippase family protein [Nitrospinota bacterium]|tara:strand:- start:31427 stop:32845 length:1419 start_codon:yes stop_codon:yes gene_type:complete
MVKDFLYNFSGRIGSVLIGFVRSIIVPRFLGPEMYGLLSLFGLFRIFLEFLDLGISNAYYHHMADLRVKKNANKNFQTETSKYFSAQVLVNVCGIILAIIAAIFFYPKYEKQSAIYIIGICSTIVSHCALRLQSLARQQTIIEKRFKLIAAILLLESFAGSLFAMIGAILYSIIGVLIFQPVEHVVSCIAYLKKTGGVPSFKFDLMKSYRILKNSFCYFYGSLSFVILRYSDSVLIVSLLNVESLGYYALAQAINGNVKLFVHSIHDVLTPDATARIAKAEKVTDLVVDIENQSRLLSGVYLFISANAFILSSILIYLLPRFDDSIAVFKIIVISLTASYFTFYPSLLMRSKRIGKAAVYSNFSIISSIINVGVSYALIIRGYDIIGVAIGTLSANIATTILCFFYIHFFVLEKRLSLSYYASFVGPIATLGTLFFYRSEPMWVLFITFYITFLFLYHRSLKDCINLIRKRI